MGILRPVLREGDLVVGTPTQHSGQNGTRARLKALASFNQWRIRSPGERRLPLASQLHGLERGNPDRLSMKEKASCKG
jgi:hypothetical protein